MASETTMPTSQTLSEEDQHFTPIISFPNKPLMLPPTQERPFIQAPRVIALFKTIKAGKNFGQNPWTSFQLVDGEYDDLEYRLRQNESLFGFVQDKIRYDYDPTSHQLVVRMASALHELFLSSVQDEIFSQLKEIRNGSDTTAALFAKGVRLALSRVIKFPVDNTPSTTKSKSPDASFWHCKAKYPGVIIEVAYSQKRKMLGQLAKNYILDSNGRVQVVVGLDIEYRKKGSRKATLSVWRTRWFQTDDGDKLRVEEEITDESFRDYQGNPTSHSGLRLVLSDFAHKDLTWDVIRGGDQEILLSTQQLCKYLSDAEHEIQEQEALGEPIPANKSEGSEHPRR